MESNTKRDKCKGHESPEEGFEPGGAKQGSKEAQISTQKEGEPEVTEVKVLLLTFQHHDLSVLRQETAEVKTAFEQLKYSVMAEEIPMKDSSEALKKILHDWGLPNPQEKEEEPKTTLYIIYYHGHGSLNTGNGQLNIMSHNHPSSHKLCSEELPKVFNEIGRMLESGTASGSQRLKKWEEVQEKFGNLQAIARIAWGDISGTIMDAPCNTLVILDCCHAGLASAMAPDEEEKKLEFRKELLGACSWGNETQDRMSPALCEALRKLRNTGGAVSVSTLVRDMNKILVKKFVSDKKQKKDRFAPQAVHYVLERTPTDRIVLKRLKARRSHGRNLVLGPEMTKEEMWELHEFVSIQTALGCMD